MPEIVDLDELVPEDITFKYHGGEYTIPGDLRVDQTLELYSLLTKLAAVEAKGGANELKRILAKAEASLLPIFKVYQPEMEELPFGAAGLGHVLRRVLTLIGLLQVDGPEPDAPNPPVPPNRAARRAKTSTRTATKPGSRKRATSKRSAGSSK